MVEAKEPAGIADLEKLMGLNYPAPVGWVCPKCGRVYAPWVEGCGWCVPPVISTVGQANPYIVPETTVGGSLVACNMDGLAGVPVAFDLTGGKVVLRRGETGGTA